MATFIKRKSGWLAQVRLKGSPHQFETFPTKAQAVAWAAKVESDIRANMGKAKSPIKKTLYDALLKYKQDVSPKKKGMRWEEIRIDKFIRDLEFIGKLMDDADSADISHWRDKSLQRLKSSSVNREMNLLSNVFTVAMKEWKWCKHNPVREVKRPINPHSRDRITSPEEKQIMLEALGYVDGAPPETIAQRVAYAYLISLETAMRCGEICMVDETLMHLDKHYVHLPDTKNGKRRDVPLSSAAERYWRMFPKGIGLTPRQIDANWRKAVKKTNGKVVGLTFHDACHQAITDLAKKLNVLELSRMTGRSIKTLMIYYNEKATAIAKKLG